MARYIKFAILILTFTALLGIEYFLWGPARIVWLSEIRVWFLHSFHPGDKQGLQLIYLTFYLAWFMVWLKKIQKSSSALSVEYFENVCLVSLIVAALLAYFLRPENPGGSTDIIELFLGMLLGKGILLLKAKQPSRQQATELHKDLLHAFVAVLALLALFQPSWWQSYPYLNEYRWHGIWRTPNTFGLLMATGLVLDIGLCLHQLLDLVADPKQKHCLYLSFYLISACLLIIGLKMSYSRSSWLGALLGFIYISSQFFKRMHFVCAEIAPKSAFKISRSKIEVLGKAFISNWIVLSLIIVLGTVLVFWQARDTNHLIFRRIFSVGNLNDFSWRNRLLAYEGSLQMIASRPWIGYGWGLPETIYDQFYKPTSLDEAKVIELNDYLMLGMILGLPALTLFIVYLILSFVPGPFYREGNRLEYFNSHKTIRDESWLKICCRSGLIVLLVGFWFDHGLFYLSLAFPFWVLLELGRSERRDKLVSYPQP